MSSTALIEVRVQCIRWLTPAVHALVLESPSGQALPQAPAGSHIDLHLAPGLTRSYSIVAHHGARYEIAVAKDANSRGGSQYVHGRLRVGDTLQISAPRNLFSLVEQAESSLLIAGGIGITPLWAMVRRLEALQRRWTLVYAARSREHAAYLDDIEAFASASPYGELRTHFDAEHGHRPLPLPELIRAYEGRTHGYCCGPAAMLDAFESATRHWPAAQVHLERFAAPASAADAQSFTLRLSRSGREFSVPADKSILDVLLEAGIDAQYGCMQGACGLCETPVMDGTPDHRDVLLSAEAKAANKSMLICCSRSRSTSLTLDI